jgi:hypothetical protein
MGLRIRHKNGFYPFISKEDERIKAGEFPLNDNREEYRVGSEREHPQTKNGKRRFHLAPGVNERISAKALREQP